MDLITKFKLTKVPFNLFYIKITIDDSGLMKQFPAVFQKELDHCTKFQKHDAKPVFRTKRAVAYTALAPKEKELDRLETAVLSLKSLTLNGLHTW